MITDILSQSPNLVNQRLWWARFQCPYDGSRYVFDVPFTGQIDPSPFFRARGSAWYLISGYQFTMGISERDYVNSTRALDGSPSPLTARISVIDVQGGQAQAIPEIPLVCYTQWCPLRVFVPPSSASATFDFGISVQGVINPADWAVPSPPPSGINLMLGFQVSEIRDDAFIARLNKTGMGSLLDVQGGRGW